MIRSENVLRHIQELVDNLLAYCDRDEPLDQTIVTDGLNGIKNVIRLELEKE